MNTIIIYIHPNKIIEEIYLKHIWISVAKNH